MKLAYPVSDSDINHFPGKKVVVTMCNITEDKASIAEEVLGKPIESRHTCYLLAQKCVFRHCN